MNDSREAVAARILEGGYIAASQPVPTRVTDAIRKMITNLREQAAQEWKMQTHPGFVAEWKEIADDLEAALAAEPPA